MSLNNGAKEEMDKRRARIQRMKKVILTVAAVMLVLPTVLSVYTLVRLNSLQKQVAQLYLAQQEVTTAAELAGEHAGLDASVGEVGEADIPPVEGAEQPAAEAVSETESDAAAVSESAEEEMPQTAAWPLRVYLTFDDGPSYYTGQILDILDRYNARATFFVVGKEEPEMQEMYRKIVEKGHTLGMHSYSHRYNQLYASKESFLEDMDKLSGLIYDKTGVIPTLYRFPGGSSNQVSKTPVTELIASLNERGITYFDWNVSAGDASGKHLDKDAIIKNVLEGVRKHPEVVVLLHDTGDKAVTVEALPELIEILQAMDIPLCAIDDSTVPVQHIPASIVEESDL